jgi:hypothetical protein
LIPLCARLFILVRRRKLDQDRDLVQLNRQRAFRNSAPDIRLCEFGSRHPGWSLQNKNEWQGKKLLGQFIQSRRSLVILVKAKKASSIMGQLKEPRIIVSQRGRRSVPMSVNTLNKALRIMGCDTGPGGDHCAHGFRSTASTLLNEEGAFDGDVVEAQLAHDTEKKAPAARQGGAAPAWQGRQEQDPRHL